MINENELAKELEASLGMPRLVSPPLTPKGIQQAVSEATNPDTERATTMMVEQTLKIIASLEASIKDAHDVQDVIGRRIENLELALSMAHASLKKAPTKESKPTR